jgi:hypothetical protein
MTARIGHKALSAFLRIRGTFFAIEKLMYKDRNFNAESGMNSRTTVCRKECMRRLSLERESRL